MLLENFPPLICFVYFWKILFRHSKLLELLLLMHGRINKKTLSNYDNYRFEAFFGINFSLVTLSVFTWFDEFFLVRLLQRNSTDRWILMLQYIFYFLKIIVKWVMFQFARKIYFGCIVIVIWNNLFLCLVSCNALTRKVKSPYSEKHKVHLMMLSIMAIPVVEFSRKRYKIRKNFA